MRRRWRRRRRRSARAGRWRCARSRPTCRARTRSSASRPRPGEIDILVNNAGAIPPGALTGVDNETWRRAWDLKVFGYISLCRAVYPSMAARRAGVIVNVIGAAGESFDPNYIAGSTGNAGADGVHPRAGPRCQARRRARGGHQPRPDRHGADGDADARPGDEGTGRRRTLARNDERDGVRPPGTPEEIGAAVAFLASPRSAYTNATILTIDGGPG